MSKCWYCNNELTTGDNPKHFRICNKCYDEMFKSGDTIIRSFTNKISDLEAKLAKKDKENETLEAMLAENANDRKAMQEFKIGEDEYDLTDEDARNSLCWEVEALKQQLAEKERQLNLSEELLIKQEKEYDEQLEKQAKIHYRHLKERDQDKILFALEQLEKVKEFFFEEHRDEEMDTDYIITKDAGEIADYLLDQIKKLKEGK